MTTPSAPTLRGRSRAGLELARPGRDTVLLDFGGGSGTFAAHVARWHDVQVHVADVQAEALAEAADRGDGLLVTHQVDEVAPRLALADQAVDVVTMLDVLEHIGDDAIDPTLRELRRVLSDDGALIVTVPHKGLLGWCDPENLKFRVPRLHGAVYRLVRGDDAYQRLYGADAERYGNYSAGGSLHKHFDLAQLDALLATVGFQIREVRYFALVNPLLRYGMGLVEAIQHHLRRRGGVLMRLAWRVYLWDADLQAGRLSYNIAVRATKSDPAR